MRRVGFAENAISPADITAWQVLTGQAIRSWEFYLIRAMDKTYLNFRAEEYQKKLSIKGKKGK